MTKSVELIECRVSILEKDLKAQRDENLDLKVNIAMLERKVNHLQHALGDKQPSPSQSAHGIRLEDDEEQEHPQRRTRTVGTTEADDASDSRLPAG
jgi:hypothetical protein